MQLQTFASRDALNAELAESIEQQLNQAIAHKGQATLALSGGSTPVPLFNRLSHTPLTWEQVTITLVDDRWINPSEPDSNEHLLRTQLLQDHARQARFIPLWQAGMTAEEAVQSCQARLQTINGPFDIVILGMGNDGHTASLFPDAAELTAALHSRADCVAINPTQAPYPRMSLTPARLLNSRQRILHIVGEDKLATLAKALTRPPEEMPIHLFLQHPLTIYWAP
ncbi:6-phosphogluconolactonase [Amphritea opalescens]|uniref:6-phosphogluconolactonase n=1 Tax=Amphritea opalescens TaxID=2490544 RepID=A0A430KPG6_9GAMM|nr:6-phosphogluconolactonase [Amphritea opalescens]